MPAHYGNLINYITNRVRALAPPEQIADVLIRRVGGESFDSIAEDMGLKKSTIKAWQRLKWWSEAYSIALEVTAPILDRKLSQLLNKSLSNLKDSLDKGDEVTWQGKVVGTKKVCAKDSALIAAILYDKRALHRGEATSINGDVKTMEERLEGLHDAFNDIAKGELKVLEGGKK